jgi:hypothetical protein
MCRKEVEYEVNRIQRLKNFIVMIFFVEAVIKIRVA